MAELKPCPFCGGEAKIYYSMSAISIRCIQCFAVMGRENKTICFTKGKLSFDNAKEAINAWNTRTPQKKNKCGTCMYSKPTTFGKSKCWVECTNQEHIKRFCKNELARKRQATNPACDCYKEKSEPQKINHDSLCETETFKVGGIE